MNKLLLSLVVIVGFFSCKDSEPLTDPALNINIKAQYNGEPLVLLNDYIFPDGRKVNFTRFNLYVSDFSLSSSSNAKELIDVEYFDVSDIMSSISNSEKGLDYLIENLSEGSYDQIQFNIGLTPEVNATLPADYASDHPLAKSSEYWGGWNSYIFAKIEGNIDLNNNGIFENGEGMALHIGSDEANRIVSLAQNTTLEKGKTTSIELVFDLKTLFENNGAIYDIDNARQIHSVTQQNYVNILADNLKAALTVK